MLRRSHQCSLTRPFSWTPVLIAVKMRSAVIAAGVAGALALDFATTPAFDDAMIAEINAGGHGWTAGVNERFKGYTLAQAARLMGTVIGGPRKTAARAKMGAWDLKPLAPSAIPVNFSVVENWPVCANVTGNIRDQSDCGSCWAVSTSGAVTDRHCIASNGAWATQLSGYDTMSCCNGDHGCPGSDGCNGGIPEEAWGYFINTGIVTGDEYGTTGTCAPYAFPQCSHHEPGKYPACSTTEYNTPSCPTACPDKTYPTSWAKDKQFSKTSYNLNTIEEIQTDIMTRGSVVAAFTVYSDFLTYKSGVYTHKSGASLGGHAVRVVGWGEENNTKYWLVANSWNSGWGANGYFKIKRGVNECGFEDDISAGSV